uniref:Ribonuclease P n=1 Tax=Solanum tuberosum TaxID=4113 RepID=M0ZKT3_SOLTU
IFMQQQFSVGVNEVTRVLERMPPIPANERSSLSLKMHSTRLQVILIASDCHPRLLTKHVESLASSKKVPVVFVKDKKRGSLRLGELVKLKTAIAIGVKVREFSFFVPVDIELDFSNFKCVIWYASCRIKETSLINLSALKYSISLNDYIAMRLHTETLINSVL